jgi:type IV fimbrial biogenesis protein FimT
LLEPLMAAPMPRAARGLTLIELMVALGVLAVLLSLAVPSFGNLLARHRLKAAAEHLAVDLAELRFEATQRGQALHLHFMPGTDWCYALATAPGCDCRNAQPCQLKTVRAGEHRGVQLVQGDDALFEPMRRSSAGQAVLQGVDGAQLRVALTPLGRPKVCAPGAAVPGYAAC